MKNFLKSFVFFIMVISFDGAFADEVNISNMEPVIKQCLKDHICTCKYMGGDVYNEGLKTRCVFNEQPIESVYSYFMRFHSPELSGLLLKKIPTSNKHLVKKNKDRDLESEVNYIVSKSNNNLEIELDFIYGGYNYIFTSRGNDTILEFLYFSYN